MLVLTKKHEKRIRKMLWNWQTLLDVGRNQQFWDTSPLSPEENTFTLTGKISRGSSFRPATVGGKILLISVMSRFHPWSLTAGKEHIMILSKAKSWAGKAQDFLLFYCSHCPWMFWVIPTSFPKTRIARGYICTAHYSTELAQKELARGREAIQTY